MMKKVKKALIKSAFYLSEKKGGQEMKVIYSFDTRKLVDSNNNILATITKEGLLVLSFNNVTLENFKHIKKFIEEYKPLGFYDKESEKIYYKMRNKEESTK